MTIQDTVVRTIKCEAEGCEHADGILFDRKEEQQIFTKPENAWLKGLRLIQTADGRQLAYCSDACEVKGVATGKHNLPEPKRIIEAGNSAAVAAAAQSAATAKAAEKMVREGTGGQIQVATS